MSDKLHLGKHGEDFAAAILAEQGYTITERNYRCKIGEIDIIAEKEDELCFVEVKTRRSERFGRPAEAVNGEKQKQLRRVASWYMQSCGYPQPYISFQVIEVLFHQIEHAF